MNGLNDLENWINKVLRWFMQNYMKDIEMSEQQDSNLINFKKRFL